MILLYVILMMNISWASLPPFQTISLLQVIYKLIPLELINSHVQGQGAILEGVLPLGSPNLDPISDEKMFHTRFWTLASKIHARFQTWRWSQTQHTYLTEIISSLLRLERQQKDVFLS